MMSRVPEMGADDLAGGRNKNMIMMGGVCKRNSWKLQDRMIKTPGKKGFVFLRMRHEHIVGKQRRCGERQRDILGA
jgi:hypothetical protein